MLGIIICTHANLASGLYDSVQMICGKQVDFDVVGFAEGEDMLSLSGNLQKIAERYEAQKQPYVVLVDIFGATPFNASAAGLSVYNTSIMTGVNLPMLLELVMARENFDDYDACLENALESAKGNMRIVKMKDMFQ